MNGTGVSVAGACTVTGGGEGGSVGGGVASAMVGVGVVGAGTVCGNGTVNSGKYPAEAKDASALPSRMATSNSPRARAFHRLERRKARASNEGKLPLSDATKRGGGAM